MTFCPGCGAENLSSLTAKTNLNEPETFHLQQFDYLNMTSMYILGTLAGSQSMNLIWAAFKNLKAADKIMNKKFPDVDGLAEDVEGVSEAPYIRHTTISYAVFVTISCICYTSKD